ncbi:hypothetical protein EDC94DRAFT_628316 [Helicostylum pulchrum]|nr:hypothetical protein EDC94DRAFT_628316 [Helicostylum pulchrum]
MEEVNLIKRPTLLRSPPSIQLTTFTAHAQQQQQQQQINEEKTILYPSRTQHKMMLQRQSFLADDKNYLDHPDNMRRLTKELERVNREYRFVKQFQDPLALSIQRVSQSCPSSLYTPSIPSLKRRASHDYLLHFNEERRHSTGFIGRIFGKRHSPLFF